MAEQKPRYHEKLWSDECQDADKDMSQPQTVYEFRGRRFREEADKPYEPPK